MFSFKNYLLLRENMKVPSDFITNIKVYLSKLRRELQLHLVIQCAEHVLPKWEDWVKTSTLVLTPEEQAAPRNAIEVAKTGKKTASLRAAQAVLNVGYHCFLHGAGYTSSAVDDAIDTIGYAAHAVSNFNSIGVIFNITCGLTAANSAGMKPEEIYAIYNNLLKTKNIKRHMPEKYRFSPDIIAMIKAAKEDPHQMPILADKLEDQGFSNQEILAHLRKPNIKWNSNDWVFKTLLDI